MTISPKAIVVAMLLASCGEGAVDSGSDPSASQEAARAMPVISVSPNPVQAGSVAITKPMVNGTGFQPTKSYALHMTAGLSGATALQDFYYWVTPDKNGSFSVPISDNTDANYPDLLLVAGTATVVASSFSHNYTTETILATANFQVTADPGTATVSPTAANPGATFTVTGSGAQAGEALTVQWLDATNCSCSWFSCSGCTLARSSVTVTADSSGAFSGAFTPTSQNSGYCNRIVSILDQASGAIVATTGFTFCP